MAETNLVPFLIFPLIGGYAYSVTWTPSLYHSAREDGHRLYFRSVFYGFFLTSCAICTHVILIDQYAWYTNFLTIISHIRGHSEVEPSIWSAPSKIAILVISFVLGPAISHLLNLSNYFPRWKNFQLKQAIRHNDFEKLVYRSAKEKKPLLITLDSGKLYVGWAASAPNPEAARKSIKILPLLSGYRNTETQRVAFTTNYHEILTSLGTDDEIDHLSEEDFVVVLPTESISSAHGFDIVAYERFGTHSASSSPANDNPSL